MIDLTAHYLGLTLDSPLVASSSPLCQDIGNIRAMEDAGASAVVLHSLFEEQITLESRLLDAELSHGIESFAESITYLPELTHYNLGPEQYLEHVRRAKAAVDIPVIGSLNGASPGGWVRYARLIEQAGADALELNIYVVAADLDRTSAEVEARYEALVREVRSAVHIPLAVKLGHHFSAFGHFARRIAACGADALVLFNRFYQPDLDIEALEVTPTLSLSVSYELLLRLTWVAMLSGRVNADLAITGGVHTAQDVLKSMMAGANVAMTTSALLRHGIGHLTTVRRDLLSWMDEHEYASIEEMRGSLSQSHIAHPEAYERANYLRVLSSYAIQ
jgi:dihydroorotate dehydrogenase (fumarate)